jgi:hypothetical protein
MYRKWKLKELEWFSADFLRWQFLPSVLVSCGAQPNH